MKEQIEEMATVIYEKSVLSVVDIAEEIARTLFEAGYRKQIYGVWEIVKYDPFVRNYRCSSCKKESVARFQFCPNCGAHMNGGEI